MLSGRALHRGEAAGEVLVLDEPLSFWGGLDPASGRIVDAHHPQAGASIRGRVLATPSLRGSTSSGGVLAESIRLGTGPVAVVSATPDVTLVLAAVVAEELYGRSVPVVVVDEADFRSLSTGEFVAVREDAEITIDRRSGEERRGDR